MRPVAKLTPFFQLANSHTAYMSLEILILASFVNHQHLQHALFRDTQERARSRLVRASAPPQLSLAEDPSRRDPSPEENNQVCGCRLVAGRVEPKSQAGTLDLGFGKANLASE